MDATSSFRQGRSFSDPQVTKLLPDPFDMSSRRRSRRNNSKSAKKTPLSPARSMCAQAIIDRRRDLQGQPRQQRRRTSILRRRS